jgi:lipid-binding SYLF domain-containing protein
VCKSREDLCVHPVPRTVLLKLITIGVVQSFVDSGNNGLDGVVPRSILERARGFAIFTVVKAGFIVSARAGSGIVIARLDDGCTCFFE